MSEAIRAQLEKEISLVEKELCCAIDSKNWAQGFFVAERLSGKLKRRALLGDEFSGYTPEVGATRTEYRLVIDEYGSPSWRKIDERDAAE